ncbi:beta-1,3-galactosyl-O-glycosyl-glycoprotein beta-1,6-N-acetylglucosaminyltransferase 3-like, partial [Chiloscyllium plagiosum]|uniref:beta-1,3-galactosyl-O-glycosyl-glycoprotein beta-1,6-N-acetylglucosaminyltransferase 3-like n=1 Tax=Chiloscyllium plagiosum TaxID=36176 RepID=UPI001CB82DB5
LPLASQKRWRFHHAIRERLVITEWRKEPPNISTSVFVGSAYIAVSREFVAHVFASAEVQAFLRWSEDTYSPDEHVWATLLRMRGVPGYHPYTRRSLHILGRAVKWSFEAGNVVKGAPYGDCTGTYRHLICVYGVGDISWLLLQESFFANKFDPEVDNMAVQCMEEYLRNKTLREAQRGGWGAE